ncbi:MAG: BamA/TamA family outer membrane protein [Chitinophagaceae bacterium]|nr:BamA/TamA family outer membrane protein [Chitinophagaceae bacterium]
MQYLAADSFPLPSGLKSSFSGRPQAETYLRQLLPVLQAKGYWAASIDTIRLDSLGGAVTVFAGRQYKLRQLILPAGYQQLAGGPATGSKRLPGGLQPSPEQIREQWLDYFENNGYPFAAVWFDSIALNQNEADARLAFERGTAYRIDSIFQAGSLRMKPGFLYRYLDLPKGAPYSKARLEGITARLQELRFATVQRPWDLSMLSTGGVLNVYLEPRRSNVFNVLIGLMPANTQTPGNRLLLTGDANILLRNAFRAGESIGINWQQIQYQSPRLNLSYTQPYLWGSQLGIDAFFELFRKDSQFVNLQARVGVPYQFSLKQTGKLLLLRRQTSVTTLDTAFVLANRRLPDLAAVSATSVGVEYQYNSTDYRLNPRRGAELTLWLQGGTKTIQISNALANLKDPIDPNFDFTSLYNGIDRSTYQLKAQAMAAKYLPLGTFSVLKAGLQAGFFQSANYFRNELFQIGGFRLLRGFDEESIFARAYSVATVEYRLLTGRNGYFFGFTDGGWAQYKDQNLQFGHTYLGAGLGIALETKNSVLNLSWAVGKRNDLPLDLRQSKIHLGLVNFF